jgi:hypothetical protein
VVPFVVRGSEPDRAARGWPDTESLGDGSIEAPALAESAAAEAAVPFVPVALPDPEPPVPLPDPLVVPPPDPAAAVVAGAVYP